MDINYTNKILQKLEEYDLKVVDLTDCPDWVKPPIVCEEYFNEKINEIEFETSNDVEFLTDETLTTQFYLTRSQKC